LHSYCRGKEAKAAGVSLSKAASETYKKLSNADRKVMAEKVSANETVMTHENITKWVRAIMKNMKSEVLNLG